MECKFGQLLLLWGVFEELIDTLWNVNESVKIFKTSRVDGINRYIMECKF